MWRARAAISEFHGRPLPVERRYEAHRDADFEPNRRVAQPTTDFPNRAGVPDASTCWESAQLIVGMVDGLNATTD